MNPQLILSIEKDAGSSRAFPFTAASPMHLPMGCAGSRDSRVHLGRRSALRSGRYPVGSGPHSPMVERDHGAGIRPLGGSQGGSSGLLWGHLLLASLTQKSGNGVSGDSRQVQGTSQVRGDLAGVGGPLPSLVVWPTAGNTYVPDGYCLK